MIDCDKTREHLDVLTAAERVKGGDVASHLETCSDCQQYVSELNQLDDQVRSSLLDVPVPEGLQSRLISSLQQELRDASPSVVKPLENHGRGNRSLSKALLLKFAFGTMTAAAVLVCVSFFWKTEDTVIVLNYENVKDQLVSQFEDFSDEDWDELPAFDNGFPSPADDNELSGWKFGRTVGQNLDHDPQHDVWTTKFSYKRWSGILIAMPASKVTNTPQSPSAGSGRKIAQWRSANGQVAYVCIVQEGPPANKLLDEIFSSFA